MNEKINQIDSKRKVTEDFAPQWDFSGTVYHFDMPLSEEGRKTAEEIIHVLNKLLENK